MMVNVVKRDGRMEPFDKEKLTGSIKKAMIDAKLSVEDLENDISRIEEGVIETIGSKGEIDASEIRNAVLEHLEKTKSVAASAWRNFDGKYKT